MINLTRLLIILHDLLMTGVAVILALALRFDSVAFLLAFDQIKYYLLPFICVAGLVYASLSLYASKWRYASLPDMVNIIKAALMLSAVLVLADYVFVSSAFGGDFIFGKKTIIIYVILQIILLGAPRLLYRYYKVFYSGKAQKDIHATLIIGKASDAELIARANEMQAVKGSLMGLLSPQARDLGQRVRNIKVLGEPSQLLAVLNEFAARGTPIETAIIVPESLPSLEVTSQVMGVLRRNNVTIRRFRFNDLMKGEARLVPMRAEEVILRPLVPSEETPLEALIKGQKIIITGGGGSIGTEMTLRVASLQAAEILVIEHSEPALYAILEKLELDMPMSKFSGKICDIRDENRLTALFKAFKPDIVFHAAALKHVPYLEAAPIEAVRTNALGTMHVAKATLAAKAKAMVLISTDKATRPTSILGATKRLAEFYMQMMDAQNHETRFVGVRFGNVLGTSGSVVPRFRNQIREGGPVTVTHKDMVRYFMTVREATDLVLTAAAHALSDKARLAAIYVLNMGQPVNIYQLAERLIRMAGHLPHEEIAIKVTGIRPGERLNEELFAPDEPLAEIGLSGIMASQAQELTQSQIEKLYQQLVKLAKGEDEEEMVKQLLTLVPGFKPFILPKS